MHRNIVAIALVVASTFFTVPAAFAAEADQLRGLTIVGRAEIQVAPDLAYVTVGVSTEAETASAALAANSSAITKVVETIRGGGVLSRDIQTSGLALHARYYHPRTPSDTDRPRIIGYTANNNVTIRVRDLAKLGALLDKVVTAGANQIRGISFDVSSR